MLESYIIGTIIGGDGADTITANWSSGLISGGFGDDTLLMGDYCSGTVSGGEGADTIRVSQFSGTVTGGDGADTIMGHADQVSGDAGSDLLFADYGKDAFMFTAGFGRDTVMGINLNAEDKILFSSDVFSTWSDVWAATTKVGSDLIITKSLTDSIALKNVDLANFTSDDVRFTS